ncbi:MAG: glycosyltransferase family 4 protein [Chloroflexi bacterium]|nr:glycosyltransferase family 4 protein [Chloroflexota bacterium]
MRIALCINNMQCGGIATFVIRLSRYLIEAGHAVVVVAITPGEMWSILAENDIPGVVIPPGRWESAVHYSRRVADHFSAARYDVAFFNSVRWSQYARSGLHLIPDETAAVSILHGDRALLYEQTCLTQRVWNLIVAVSPRIQQRMAAQLPNKHVQCILCGVALPSDAALSRRTDWELPLRLLYVGRLRERPKGILLLPGILAACRTHGLPVQMTVIGDGPDREALARDLVQQNVMHLAELRGLQSAEAVYRAMQNHHILLLPSYNEGLALVLLEAQANGCVPVASRLIGMADVAFEDSVTGCLAEVGDAEAFAQCIARMMDPARWRAYSQAGVERAARLFSVDVMGNRYLDLIDNIANGAYQLNEPRNPAAHSRYPSSAVSDHLPRELRLRLNRLHHRLRQRMRRSHQGQSH